MPLMRSWVESANSPDSPFPLNNLPYGVFTQDPDGIVGDCCVAIGDYVLDMSGVSDAGHIPKGILKDDDRQYFFLDDWSSFVGEGASVWAKFRSWLTEALAEGSSYQAALEPFLIAQEDVVLLKPFYIEEFTDFYANKHHAMNVGTMFRGAENALPANWLHIPIGYNGRASSVIGPDLGIMRPNGQTKATNDPSPVFGPSQRLDFELELGAIVGDTTLPGETLTVQEADDIIFGYVLLNDWSARDIQAWEYQPLGPFQGKAFATSIGPWIVTKAALEPFRTHTPPRETPLLPYLQEPGPMLYDIHLAVSLAPDGKPATTITRTNYNEMYYASAQQLAHHASSGCPMNVGDLLGSGTISGPEKTQRGSLLELTWGGKEPITLDTGETRTFLEDGDTVTLHGTAKGDGYQIGFGTCSGTILPAKRFP